MPSMFDDPLNRERFHNARQATAPGAPAGQTAAQGGECRPDACSIVRVHGCGPEATPLDEQAYTLRVTDNGGELMLSTPVRPGQELLLINEVSQRQQSCRIAGAHRRGPHTVVIAVTFPAPHPEFWQTQGAVEEQRARELELAMAR
jgi:hypothetical protein